MNKRVQSVRDTFSKNKILLRNFLILFFVFVLILSIFSVILYSNSRRVVQSEFTTATAHEAENLISYLDNSIMETRYMASTLESNEVTKFAFSSSNPEAFFSNYQKQVSDILIALQYSRKSIDAIYLYSGLSNQVYTTSNQVSRFLFNDREWLDCLDPDEYGFSVFPYTMQHRYPFVICVAKQFTVNGKESAMGIIVMAWLYGEGDFDRCISIAASCGEDSDCTAGTLAAILGIIHGNTAIDEKWLRPLGGMIETSCVNRSDTDISVPCTIEELVERVAVQMPRFLPVQFLEYSENFAPCGVLVDDGSQFYKPENICCWYSRDTRKLMVNPFNVTYNDVLFRAFVDYHEAPYLTEGVAKKFTVTFENNTHRQQWLKMSLHAPDGWDISPAKTLAVNLEQPHCNVPLARVEIEVTPHNLSQPRYDLVLQVISDGHAAQMLVPIVLLTSCDYQIFSE